MRRTILQGSLILVTLLFLGGCSGIAVRQDYDPKIDLTAIDSYTWVEAKFTAGGDTPHNTPLLHQRIRRAIDIQMVAQGYRRTVAKAGDVQLAYRVRFRTHHDANRIRFGFGFGNYGSSGFSSIGIGTTAGGSDRLQAELSIEMRSPDGRSLYWQGSGERRYDQDLTPEQSEQWVSDLVAAILKQFPPQPTQ